MLFIHSLQDSIHNFSSEMTTKAVKHNAKLGFKHFPYLCYVSSLEKVKAELQQLKEIQTLNAGLAQT